MHTRANSQKKLFSGQRFKISAIFQLIYVLAVMLYEAKKGVYKNCQPLGLVYILISGTVETFGKM